MPTTAAKKSPAPANFDNDIANRLFEFRIAHISKSQKKAAELLEITPAWLSYLESGQRRLRMDVVEKMVRLFDLNAEWLSTGLGAKQTKTPEKPTAATSLSSVLQEVLIIKKTLSIFEANLTHAYKLIESQSKIIEDLKNELAKK